MVTKIRKTKEALLSRVHALIGMMSQHLVALTSTVESVDPEKNNIVYGGFADLKDSMETKIEMLQRQIKKWEHRIYQFIKKGAADSLSPIKEKINKLGKKKKLKVGKIKGSHKVTNTNITAKKIQQMEEAGHPPIKIKFKRLTSFTTKSQTVSQPESSDHQPHCPASSEPATQETNELVGDCPHPIP